MTLWTRDVIYKAGFESQSVACRGRHWVVVTSNVGWQAIRGSESRGSGRWRSWQTGSRTPWGGIAGHRGLTTHTDHHRTACASSVGTRPGGARSVLYPLPVATGRGYRTDPAPRAEDTGRTRPPGQVAMCSPAPGPVTWAPPPDGSKRISTEHPSITVTPT